MKEKKLSNFLLNDIKVKFLLTIKEYDNFNDYPQSVQF